MLYTVIMAGGSGTRLWPASRRRLPKQIIPLLGGKSLFARTLERVSALASPRRTFVVTSAEQAKLLRAQARSLPRSNIIAEPVPRDSAAAIFLAASIILARDPHAVMFVVPADHLIFSVDRFRQCVRSAVDIARDGRYLLTFGIKPSYPSTAYGYVERAAPLKDHPGGFKVRRFHEKPDARTAARYLKDPRFYWNSGMFVWRASSILDAARSFCANHHWRISPLGPLFGARKFAPALSAAYGPLKKVSIDYAIMEKAPNVAMVEGDFEWSDVGSPLAFRDIASRDKAGNVRQGLTELLDSRNCIALTDNDHLLAVYGCDDLVVIRTKDATLVYPASLAEDLKRLIASIERRNDLRKYL